MFKYSLVIAGMLLLSGCFQKESPKPAAAEVTDPPGTPTPALGPEVPSRPATPEVEPGPSEAPQVPTPDHGVPERAQTPALREAARQRAMQELEKARGQQAPKNDG